MTGKQKLVGVGFGKTGTTTFGQCAKILGYNHQGFAWRLTDYYINGEMDKLDEVVETHDSFEDYPWPFLYKRIDEKWPGSRFVLTVRKTPEIWFESLVKHARRVGRTNMRSYIFGVDYPWEDPARHIKMYNDHNEAVKAYFADKPGRLLTVCWETGDAWEELTSFLDAPLPNAPFPHSNRAPTYFEHAVAKAKRRFRKIFDMS